MKICHKPLYFAGKYKKNIVNLRISCFLSLLLLMTSFDLSLFKCKHFPEYLWVGKAGAISKCFHIQCGKKVPKL